MNSYTWRVHLGPITMLVQAEDVIEAIKATGWHGKMMRGGVVSVTRLDKVEPTEPPGDRNAEISPIGGDSASRSARGRLFTPDPLPCYGGESSYE